MTARVADPRQTGIADTNQVIPCQQILDKLRALGKFVMLMIARELRMDIEMRQQLTGMACILSCNKPGFAQHPHSPIGHILQVADWRRTKIQRAFSL